MWVSTYKNNTPELMLNYKKNKLISGYNKGFNTRVLLNIYFQNRISKKFILVRFD